MIRLYILYILLGFYVLYYSMLLWVFPFDGGVLQTDMALSASVVLFFIAPAVCVYKPHIAPVLGLLCLAAISPFGIHLLQYRLMNEYLPAWSAENIILYAAVACYLATLIATINIFTVRRSIKVPYYSKTAKFILALLPLAVFAALAIYFVKQ